MARILVTSGEDHTSALDVARKGRGKRGIKGHTSFNGETWVSQGVQVDPWCWGGSICWGWLARDGRWGGQPSITTAWDGRRQGRDRGSVGIEVGSSIESGGVASLDEIRGGAALGSSIVVGDSGLADLGGSGIGGQGARDGFGGTDLRAATARFAAQG